MGSTRALTDDVGDATDTYVYDAWGNEVDVVGTTVNPFRWVGWIGYYYDEATGTFYVRRRIYEPEDGRWMSQDPLAFVDGPNVYAYANNAPASYVDPLGLARCLDLKECSDCVLLLLEKDPKIKIMLDIMKEWNKKGKPKCKVKAFCCATDSTDPRCQPCKDKPKLLGELLESEFDKGGESYIIMCPNKFEDYSQSTQYPKHGKCGHLGETLQHELVHYMDRCRRRQGKIEAEDCEACVCDELRGHWYSGQCSPGSVYYETGGGVGTAFGSPAECLMKSLITACDLACKLALVDPEDRPQLMVDKSKNCAKYPDLGQEFPPPFNQT